MQVALTIDSRSPRTLQEQVFDQIREMILSGRLNVGDPVPGSRMLAGQLGVSRNTVTIAYDKLLAEGYLEIRPNVGTFVAPDLPDMALGPGLPAPQRIDLPLRRARSTILDRLGADEFPVQAVRNPAAARLQTDFWLGRIDPRLFPVAEWRRLLDVKLRHGRVPISQYSEPAGLAPLRRAIADHLGPARGIACQPEQIVVTAGSQDGLMLIARALAGHCRSFLHEDPGYSGAIHLFGRFGLACRPVPVDRDGLVVEALPEERAAVLYVTPSHQFPTGATLSLPRRLQLLEWAERTDSLIIEDDYDGDFRHDGAPLTALRGIDRTGRVLYLGTFSKSLSPALRLGFVLGSAPAAAALTRWKHLLSNGPPWHMQAVLAEFMESGAFQRHLRRIRTTYRQRRDALIEAIETHFPGSGIIGRRGGMHLAWQLPDRGCARNLCRRALMRGIGIYTAEDGGACLSPGNHRHRDLIMLGYAAIDEAAIRAAIAALAELDGRG
ncbi:MAG: PLP-dependent aminotransferase family protein [Gemmobacter sp.]